MKNFLENFTINDVFTRVVGGAHPYSHQLKTAKSLLESKSVVLRAPCGSGKTEACYVSLLLGRNSNLPEKLIYSLPTRALVEDVSDRIKKGISILGLPPIVSPQHGGNSEDPFFKSEIVVATIDQTIGAYCCTPLSLPVHLGNIPAGAVVSSFLCFDEAHIYDHLLGLQSILVLVERAIKLELPFLVMSATFPDSFVEWFKEKFADRIEIVEGKEEDVPKRRNRCVILKWKGKFLKGNHVLDCVDSWKRIMVVCNTVDRAQTLYENVKEPLKNYGFNVVLLHSRFLDKDRKKIENDMKNSLKDPDKKTCLVSTQVCEVGLDISCDLLLTELAPPDSLIQRMGRCAREGGDGEVWVFEVGHSAPYKEKDMERSRRYISEKLDGKRVRWNEELEFVNTILGEEFQRIMNDDSHRRKILLSLADATFKGSKREIESNIREVLSANLSIHDEPDNLEYHEILSMPWINVNVGVLRRHLNKAKFWKINFVHDENGKPTFYSTPNAALHPHGYYIAHPNHAMYDLEKGLILGKEGKRLKPYIAPLRPRHFSIIYEKEKWEEHIKRCLLAFNKIKIFETHALKLLSNIINCDLKATEGLVALSISVHDLGKLNERWQKEIGILTSNMPLAHVPITKKIGVPHATISAYASYPLFRKLVRNIYHALAFKLAIAHHHHTRAERVRPYVLKWHNLYKNILKRICDKYSLNVNPDDIRSSEEFPKSLEISMFDLESTKNYTAYCIIARFIRLSDQASFSIKERLKTPLK